MLQLLQKLVGLRLLVKQTIVVAKQNGGDFQLPIAVKSSPAGRPLRHLLINLLRQPAASLLQQSRGGRGGGALIKLRQKRLFGPLRGFQPLSRFTLFIQL